MELAMDAATEAFREELKTVETCQAYLLLSVYPVPKRKLTDDRRWLLMAISIRYAVHLARIDSRPLITVIVSHRSLEWIIAHLPAMQNKIA